MLARRPVGAVAAEAARTWQQRSPIALPTLRGLQLRRMGCVPDPKRPVLGLRQV